MSKKTHRKVTLRCPFTGNTSEVSADKLNASFEDLMSRVRETAENKEHRAIMATLPPA